MSKDIEKLKKMMQHLAVTFEGKRDYLIELDSVMGDGDLGITMSKIFIQASKDMQYYSDSSVGAFFFKSGMIMSKTAPSTMGTLMASAFMEAGKLLKEHEVIDVELWKIFFNGVQGGIVKRGKASVGDKTIFDVFYPVYESTIDVDFENESAFFSNIKEVAETSLHNTKDMKAQFGKAACFGDKSIGHEDAGATVAYLLIDSMHTFLREYS